MHIQFAELPVFDQDRAKKFYTEHLNCQVAADQPHGRWRMALDRAQISGGRNGLAFRPARR